MKSVKAVMADRSLALSTLQSARSDVDAKRTKLAKLRGTPGIKVRVSLHMQLIILDKMGRVWHRRMMAWGFVRKMRPFQVQGLPERE